MRDHRVQNPTLAPHHHAAARDLIESPFLSILHTSLDAGETTMFNQLQKKIKKLNASSDFVNNRGSKATLTLQPKTKCVDLHYLDPDVLLDEIKESVVFDPNVMDAAIVYRHLIAMSPSGGDARESRKTAEERRKAPTFDTSKEEIVCKNKSCGKTFLYERIKGNGGIACPHCGACERQDVFFGASAICGELPSFTNPYFVHSDTTSRENYRAALAKVTKVALNEDQTEHAIRILERRRHVISSTTVTVEEAAAAVLFVLHGEALEEKKSLPEPIKASFSCGRCGKGHFDRKSSLYCCPRGGSAPELLPIGRRRR